MSLLKQKKPNQIIKEDTDGMTMWILRTDEISRYHSCCFCNTPLTNKQYKKGVYYCIVNEKIYCRDCNIKDNTFVWACAIGQDDHQHFRLLKIVEYE